jgi:transposase
MLLDESGLLMAPLVRRGWCVRGQPREIKQKAGHREKVSVAAALYLTPWRDRLALAYQTLVNGYFNNEQVAEFVSGAVQGLTEPIVLIWDRGTMHTGGPIDELVAASGGRLILEPLPPHASKLMPLEFLWRWLKYDRLCNFPPRDAAHLNAVVLRELDPIRQDQQLLQSFFHQSDLPLPRALLS